MRSIDLLRSALFAESLRNRSKSLAMLEEKLPSLGSSDKNWVAPN